MGVANEGGGDEGTGLAVKMEAREEEGEENEEDEEDEEENEE